MFKLTAHRLRLVVALAGLLSVLGTCAGPAYAVRDTRVTIVNTTDAPVTLRWWTRDLNVETPSETQIAPGARTSVTGAGTGDNWDLVGSIGRTWTTGGASTFLGTCFAGDNPGGGYPRFEMGRYNEQDRSITLNPSPCDQDVPGAWNATFNTVVGPLTRAFDVASVAGRIDLTSSQEYRTFTLKITGLPQRPNALLRIDNLTPARGRVISDPPGAIDCGTALCRSLVPWGSTTIGLIPVPAPGMVVDQVLLAENIDQPSILSEPLCFWQRGQGPLPDCGWAATTDSPATYRVRFAPAPRQILTTTTSGDGGGHVLDDGGALVCTPDGTCTASLIEGSTVALHAVPDAGSRFGWWTGACRGKTDTCVVSMSAAQTVDAVFLERTDATLTVDVAGSGLVRGDNGLYCRTPPDPAQPNTCSITVARGTAVSLSGTPVVAGSSFTGWTGADPTTCTGTSTCTVRLAADLRVQASFSTPPTPQTFSVTRVGSGSGRVTGMGVDCGSVCQATYTPSGDRVATFQATADPGSTFAGWGGICFSSGTLATCRTGRSGALTARFDARDPGDFVKIALDIQGVGGGRVVSRPAGVDCTASCTGTFDTTTGQWRASVTLTATPDDASDFVGWQGACWGAARWCSLDMTDSRAVTAVFQPRATPAPTPIGPPDPDPGVVPEPGPLPSTPGTSPSTADTNAANASSAPPVLSQLRTSRKSFMPWQGTILRYVLNRPATMIMEFTHAGDARPRYRFTIRSGAAGARAGANSVRIVGRVRNRDVRAGLWTIRVVARTAAGTAPPQLRRVSVRG